METIKIQYKDLPKYDTHPYPEFDYCRKLLKQGVSPDTRLELYRGDMPSLYINTIAAGAKLIVREEYGCIFGKYRPFPAARIAGKAVGIDRGCV